MSWTQEAFDYGIACTRHNLETLADFPERTDGESWICAPNGGWVGGHWVGLLWLAYAHTHDPALEHAARSWAARLVPRASDETTHDLGFLFELSHLLGFQITGEATLNVPALTAARTLARRFNPDGNFIQAWGTLDAPPNQRGRAIIDTLMNLNLLFWAGNETGEEQFTRIATATAHSALTHQVRPDGSTAHVADYDPATGQFLRQETHQGFSPASCWSRGHAWAVYGFSEIFRHTQEVAFLEAANRLAQYALEHLPADGVPFWDYSSPLIPSDVRDSSAAAILAAALVQLAGAEQDLARANTWRQHAKTILFSLWQHYSSYGKPEPSILLHGTRSKPHGMVDHGLIYGDFYFMEALASFL